MMNSKLVLMSACLLAVTGVSASGSSGGGSSSNSSAASHSVDNKYESGKALFMGRDSNVAVTSFCNADGAAIDKASLQAMNISTTAELAGGLYDCNTAGQLASASVDANKLENIAYFLNKRYKLGLAK